MASHASFGFWGTAGGMLSAALLTLGCSSAGESRKVKCEGCDAGADAAATFVEQLGDAGIRKQPGSGSGSEDAGVGVQDAGVETETDAGPSGPDPDSVGQALDAGGSVADCVADEDCDNGLFCDGEERCDDGVCVLDAPAMPEDDGVECTRFACDEAEDAWVVVADDAICSELDVDPACDDDGLLVQIRGLCDVELGCQLTEQVLGACEGGDPATCEAGELTVKRRDCTPDGACDVTEVRTSCPVGAPRCDVDGNHVSFSASCANAETCSSDGEAMTTSCDASADTCSMGQLTTYQATCDSARGCGEEGNTTTCPVPGPECNLDGNYVVYAPSCADEGSCDPNGVATVTECVGSADQCSGGRLTTYAPTCDAQQACGETESTVNCPSAAPRCDQSGNHVTSAPACASATACLTAGAQTVQVCSAPPDECQAGKLTTFDPTCDDSAGCGVTSSGPSVCPVKPDECLGSQTHVSYQPACDGESQCKAGGDAVQTPCTVPGNTCSGGTLTTYTPVCDADKGCGQKSQQADCPTPSPTCTNAGDFVDYAPVCSNGTTCDPKGNPSTTPCNDRCANGVFYAGTCSTQGCGESAGTDCAVRDPVCSKNANGQAVYTKYRPQCRNASTCADGGVVASTTICESSYQCSNGTWVEFQGTCSAGGCTSGEAINKGKCESSSWCDSDDKYINKRTCTCSGSPKTPCSCQTTRELCPASYYCIQNQCQYFG